MSEASVAEPLVIDVRPIPKPQRHPLIFDALEPLAVGQSVVIKNDHNPIPLRGQVEAIYGQQFEWRYLEEGPEVFRLQFTRRAPAPAGWQRPESKQSLPLLETPALQSSAPALPAVAPPAVAPPAVAPPAVAPTTASGSATKAASPVWVDVLARCAEAAHGGPQWAHECEDLDVTLLSWEPGHNIDAHINNEVDGVLVGVAGTGVVTVNGETHDLRPGVALIIPKGCERAIKSDKEQLSYLSIHRRRRGLMPTLHGQPLK